MNIQQIQQTNIYNTQNNIFQNRKNNKNTIYYNQPTFKGPYGAIKGLVENKYYTNAFSSKLTEWIVNKESFMKNIVQNLSIGGSALISGVYMYKTLTNDSFKEEQKKTLATNQFLTFAVSTILGIVLNSKLDKLWDKFTDKYVEKRAGSQVLKDLKSDLSKKELNIIENTGINFVKDKNKYNNIVGALNSLKQELESKTIAIENAKTTALQTIEKEYSKDTEEYKKLSEAIDSAIKNYKKKGKFDLKSLFRKTGTILAKDDEALKNLDQTIKSELRKADLENQSLFVKGKNCEKLKNYLTTNASDAIDDFTNKYKNPNKDSVKEIISNSLYYDEIEKVAKQQGKDLENLLTNKETEETLINILKSFVTEKQTTINKIIKDDFANKFINKLLEETKGMGILKTLLVFGIIYRFISPVAVTPVANWIGNKFFSPKEK